MDNWGRGPWFEPEADGGRRADAEQEAADAGGREEIEQPTVQRRATGGPAATLPPLPGVASRPLPAGAGRSGSWGPSSAMGVASMPTEQTPATPGAAAGESGSFRHPAMPGRPAHPSVPMDAGAEAQPWDGPGAFDGYGAYAPPSRPLVPPLPAPPGQPGWDDEMLPSGFPPAGPPPKRGNRGKRGKRGDGGGRGRPLVFWPIFVGLALLLVACSAIGLIGSGALGGSGVSATTHKPAATATATHDPNGTATPVPPPSAARLSFVPASKQLASPAGMTSCPNGCDLAGRYVMGSHTSTYSLAAAQIPQSSLFGTVHVVNNGPGTWQADNFQFSGTYNSTAFKCAPQSISLPQGVQRDFNCFVAATSPPSIPAGSFQGTASSSPSVTYSQPKALVGDGHYEVLQSDCDSALNSVHSDASSWAQNWFSGLSLPGGWSWAPNQPRISVSGDTCPVGQSQSGPFSVTVSTLVASGAAAFNPAAAQALAGGRLDGTLPGGYQWLDGSRTTCAPAVSDVAGDGKVTLTCSDAGTAVFVWGDAPRSKLASDVAGQSKATALAICNGREGVRPGSCAVAIQGGDGSVLPKDAAVVTVKVDTP